MASHAEPTKRTPSFEKSYPTPTVQSTSPPVTKMMKKKKSGSLVRKLSLNKFRIGSTDQETRQTPEGGDSSRSQSQSSQDSPANPESPPRAVKKAGVTSLVEDELKMKGREKKTTPVATPTSERRNPGTTWGHDREKGASGERRIDDGRRRQKPDKLPEKTVSTVTTLQRKSPSVTIRTSFSQERKDSRGGEKFN